MNVAISPQNVFLFLNLLFFVGQIAMVYFYWTVYKKKIDALMDTNGVLVSSVSDLVKTLTKMLEQRTINQAVAQAKVDIEEEFKLD